MMNTTRRIASESTLGTQLRDLQWCGEPAVIRLAGLDGATAEPFVAVVGGFYADGPGETRVVLRRCEGTQFPDEAADDDETWSVRLSSIRSAQLARIQS
ncbi:MAG: hypothetical protein AB7K09_16790 [Planctomycetota bacterium]